MATQDFAKTEIPAEDSAKNPMPPHKIIPLTVILVTVILGTFMGGFWLGKQQGLEAADGKDKARLEKLLREQQDEMQLLREASKQSTEHDVSTTQVGELTFYNELANQAVQPSALHMDASEKKQNPSTQTDIPSSSTDEMRKMIEEEMKQDVTTSPSVAKVISHTPIAQASILEPKSSYMLQLGSFQKQSDAYAFLEKLRKKGASPFIQRVELATRGVWYRVYLGSYNSKDEANKAKEHIKDTLKISGLVVKNIDADKRP